MENKGLHNGLILLKCNSVVMPYMYMTELKAVLLHNNRPEAQLIDVRIS